VCVFHGNFRTHGTAVTSIEMHILKKMLILYTSSLEIIMSARFKDRILRDLKRFVVNQIVN